MGAVITSKTKEIWNKDPIKNWGEPEFLVASVSGLFILGYSSVFSNVYL
jgi:hypothetical protein